jgi:hypothetical protein
MKVHVEEGANESPRSAGRRSQGFCKPRKELGNATGSLFAYPLRQSIPSTKEDTLPRVGQTVEYLDLRMI